MTSRQPVDLPAIAFLGAGSMARAILAGLLQPHVTVAGGIRATNRSRTRAAEFADEPRVTAYSTEADAAANRYGSSACASAATTGCPCGGRGVIEGPRTLNRSLEKSIVWSLPASRILQTSRP